MRNARTFLVVADDPERLMLVSATLHRKFPNSVVQTCRESGVAIEVAGSQHLDAIVTLRCADLDELSLAERLRAVTSVPILLMTSSPVKKETAVAAGASAVLLHGQWLLIGTTVGELVGASPVS